MSKPPVGKRNVYNLFYKYHRLLLLQSLGHENDARSSSNPQHEHESDHTHWSYRNDLVKNWNSPTIRPLDFNTFEEFMMRVLEIDIGPGMNYLQKEKRSHVKSHGLISLHDMAKTISEIWKANRKEMQKVFQDFAGIDSIRYERDMIVYNLFVHPNATNMNENVTSHRGTSIVSSTPDSLQVWHEPEPEPVPEVYISATNEEFGQRKKKRRVLNDPLSARALEPIEIECFTAAATKFSNEEISFLRKSFIA